MAENITLDYAVDVNDPTEPKDGRSVMKGSEELRKVKEKLNQVSGGSFNKGGMPANAVIYAPRYRFGDKTYAADASNKLINQSLHNKTPNFLQIVTSGTTKLRLKASATFPVYMSCRHGFSDGGYSDTLIKTTADIDVDIPANATDLIGLYPTIYAKTNANRNALDSLAISHAKPIVDYDWPRYRGYRIDQLESITLAGAQSFVDYFGNKVEVNGGVAPANVGVKLGSDGKLWMYVAGNASGQFWRIGNDEDVNEVIESKVFTLGFDWYFDQAINAGTNILNLGTLSDTAYVGRFRIWHSGGKFHYYLQNSPDTAGTTTVTQNTKYSFRFVKVGKTVYVYVNGVLDATFNMYYVSGPGVASGDRVHLGDYGGASTAQQGSYFKNFYMLPYYVPAKPAGYAADDLGWLELPLFVDKVTGQVYKVTGRATPATVFPVLTEESYSIIALGFYTKYDSSTPAIPLQFPFDFSMLENKLHVHGVISSWADDILGTWAKFNLSTNSTQGVFRIDVLTNQQNFEVQFLYPGLGELTDISAAITRKVGWAVSTFTDSVSGFSANGLALCSFLYNGSSVTDFRLTFAATQQIF